MGPGARGLLRGRLEAAAGDLPASLRFPTRALDQHEGAGWPFERARTLLALGELQRRTKQKRAGRQSLTAALATFDELGAAIWSARTRGALGADQRQNPRRRLTATEQRVADLVATGRTNREVASAFFIATRTSSGTLSKIYAKLGLRSRSSSHEDSPSAERPWVSAFPDRLARVRCPHMPEYLVELYVGRASAAPAETLSRARIRETLSILVPSDETCLLLYDAARPEEVTAALQDAEITYDRIVEATVSRW